MGRTSGEITRAVVPDLRHRLVACRRRLRCTSPRAEGFRAAGGAFRSDGDFVAKLCSGHSSRAHLRPLLGSAGAFLPRASAAERLI